LQRKSTLYRNSKLSDLPGNLAKSFAKVPKKLQFPFG
jgi:hypothetical protein